MTNRDVAAALFISPKTVEANLARIYRKLGIKSRAGAWPGDWRVTSFQSAALPIDAGPESLTSSLSARMLVMNWRGVPRLSPLLFARC